MRPVNAVRSALALCALLTASATSQAQSATFEAPGRYVSGYPFKVKVHVQVGEDGTLDSSLLGAGGFTVNGKPLAGSAKSQKLQLTPGQKLTSEFDLGAQLDELSSGDGKSFTLAHVGSDDAAKPQTVSILQGASKDIDFMNIDAAELSGFGVLLQTIHGEMLLEFWPDVAPDHVRNFLDLSSTGFYEGTIFHRVSPGFMIQGGDPTGTGRGNGPRNVEAEFNDRKHVRGVHSMARSQSPDSASCQFFVMHGRAPALDNKYSAFGKMVDGGDVLDEIANARGELNPDRTVRPSEPQRIERAIVVLRTSEKYDG